MPYADPAKQREYQQRWYQERRDEWIAANGPCRLCGSSEDLEVDHKDAAQKVSHRIWSWSEARRNEELAKCWVLCRECHIKKTSLHQESPSGENHGRSVMSEVVVVEMKRRYKAGDSIREMAAEFGLNYKSAYDAVKYGWKHLD